MSLLKGTKTEKNLLTAFAGESQARNRYQEKVVWRCRHCGYIHEGEEAPKLCPACAHPLAHFEILAENWQTIFVS
jgi:rubrerythrin